MTKAPRSSLDELLLKLRHDLSDLSVQARTAGLTPHSRRKLNKEIEHATQELNTLLAELDPIKRPRDVFDPGNPRTIGFFVALALTAQERQPLGELRPAYGSGVYALYYNGDFDLYSPLRNTETPIYIGSAAPGGSNSRTPIEQGPRLAA